ncbi:hypothetical protein [Kitasatospora sp. NPDC050543]|uniref:hypothetical protein n=1 Tax=Kitasatospora sp. NPDC050543 TaxID=3364054 RepID=UPI0037BABB03
MTSPEPVADAQSSPWFASQPVLSPVPPGAPVVVPVRAPTATANSARDAGTPIYDGLVAAFGDPFSRLGPTRARLARPAAGTTER